MERWHGKVAVVTGASGGIGAQIAEKLVQEGMKVVGLARRLHAMEKLKANLDKYESGSFHPYQCDVTMEADILAAFRHVKANFGPVHVLINNAGLLSPEKIIDGDTDTFRRILDVNVLATAICTREATRQMLESRVRGHIVNVNSLAGHDARDVTVPVSLYCASKYAVTGMTESVRNELASLKCGIKITSVSPSAVLTDMIRTIVPEEYIDKLPTLKPEDVADAIIFALGTPPHVEVNELTITALRQ